MDIGAKKIRQWHKLRGWSDIGYHYVIRRDGRIELGRPIEQVGAHVKGHNSDSIGVCMVGGLDEDLEVTTKPAVNFGAQWESLEIIVRFLKSIWPNAEVLGHRDLSPDTDGDGTVEPSEWLKQCPCFDAREWWKTTE